MKLKKHIEKKKKTQYCFLNIKDKINLSKTKCCPPHFWPHKLKFWEKIKIEPCHSHKAKWRMSHHKLFCKFLKCPNYDFMIKKYNLKQRKC